MFQNQMNPYRMGMPQFSAGINWVNSAQEVDQIESPPGGEIIGQLPECGMVEVSGKTENGWRQVRTADHLTVGWMNNNLV